jgi:DMSO reductase anchor subunit
MNPAFSVIFLTTLIGAGQGLFLALYTVEVYSLFDVLPRQDDHALYAAGSAVALVLLGLGLVASFFHLGRPERGWRAAARWRTSWLSREVIVLPAFMGAVLLFGAAHWSGWESPGIPLGASLVIGPSVVIGALATTLALALFLCTGMIYACIRFLQEWATPLTVVNYTLLGIASGFMFATVFSAHAAPQLVGFFAGWAAVFTGVALATRGASQAEILPADGDRREASAHHPDHPGLHGRLVQHAGVLSRAHARVSAVGQVDFSRARVRAAARRAGRRGGLEIFAAARPRLRDPVFRAAGRALVLPGAGQSSTKYLLSSHCVSHGDSEAGRQDI